MEFHATGGETVQDRYQVAQAAAQPLELPHPSAAPRAVGRSSDRRPRRGRNRISSPRFDPDIRHASILLFAGVATMAQSLIDSTPGGLNGPEKPGGAEATRETWGY